MSIKTSVLAKHVAVFRIAFGVIWAIDATFKWFPAFRNGFLDQITSAAHGQPSWLDSWFNFWTHFLGHNPHLFAILVAIVESLVALALLFGFARRTTYLLGIVFSLFIWGVAEGFGGPYSSASTDIGVAVIYAVVFFALYGLERLALPPKWSVDSYISKRISWWKSVAQP